MKPYKSKWKNKCPSCKGSLIFGKATARCQKCNGVWKL